MEHASFVRTLARGAAMAALCCSALAVAADAPRQVAGYRRDGSGVFPDCKPPLDFDLATGRNVRWEAKLPSWGHGGVIAVRDRAFLMVESDAKIDYPRLLCLDAATGRELWQAVINPFEAAAKSPAQRAKAEADWHEVRQFMRKKYQCTIDVAKADDKDRDAVMKAWEAKGVVYGSGGDRIAPTDKAAYETRTKDLARQYGVTIETWHDRLGRGTNCIGQVHASPISDGQNVYVATAWGVFACFDLDGKRQWLVSYPGSAGEYCRNGRSPILHGELLISDITNLVRAIDRKTGKLVWSDQGPAQAKTAKTEDDIDTGGPGGGGSSTIVTPNILTVGGVDVLWAAGCCAYRLPDGKRLKVVGWKDEGMQTLVKHDQRDVAYFCGAGEHCGWTSKGKGVDPMPPAAVRFALAGDTLKAQVLWSGIDGQCWGGNGPWMLYHDGKFYARGYAILDALTGKIIKQGAGKGGAGPVPDSRHLLQVANGHVYGLTRAKGGRSGTPGAVLGVCTLDGKPVASSTIQMPQPTKEELELIRTCERQEDWPEFSKGYCFTFGPDCLYVRSYTRLWCLGTK